METTRMTINDSQGAAQVDKRRHGQLAREVRDGPTDDMSNHQPHRANPGRHEARQPSTTFTFTRHN
jgi:hypothetical protein